jgi:hypothetical protein
MNATTAAPVDNATSGERIASFGKQRDIFGLIVSMAVFVYILLSVGFSRYIIRYGPKR